MARTKASAKRKAKEIMSSIDNTSVGQQRGKKRRTTTIVTAEVESTDGASVVSIDDKPKRKQVGRKKKIVNTDKSATNKLPNKMSTSSPSKAKSSGRKPGRPPKNPLANFQLSGGRKKQNRKVADTERRLFTIKEKKAFYECLISKGFSCINNEEVLQQIFPNRSMNEINAFIDSFSRKAKDLNRLSEESDCVDANTNKQPIEKWFDVLHLTVPISMRKDDMSGILVDIFSELSAKHSDCVYESQDPELAPNYGHIYACIRDSLNNRYAPQLKSIDAFVLVQMIEELKELIRNDDYSKESEFLASGKWWQLIDNKSSEDIFSDIYMRRQQENVIQDSNEEPVATTSHGTTSQVMNGIHPNVDHEVISSPLTSSGNTSRERIVSIIQNYPKLRKISECLNPIKVPIHFTHNQYKRWQHK